MPRSTRRPLLAVVAGLLAVASLAACGDSEPTDALGNRLDGATTTSTAPDAPDGCRTPEDAAAVTEAPEVVIPDAPETTPLVTDDIVGCGAEATATSTVTVNYVLRSVTTGEIADSSYDRGEPYPVDLATGGVIPGWIQGLQGIRAGGRRTLVVPPDLAYGDTGQGDIPPGDTLVFVIDAVSVA